MDYRSRFMNTMLFKSTSEVPFHEIAAWEQTVARWRSEGAPEEALKTNGWFLRGDDYFGFEPREFVHINASYPMPPFEAGVLEEDGRIIVFTDDFGVTHKALKEGAVGSTRMSMDQLLAFPLTDRKSFLALKKRFQADPSLRYPKDWAGKAKHWNDCNHPVCLTENGDFGFYSILRRFIGTEGEAYLFYDDPHLAHEMLDFFCDYMIELTHKALHEVPCDYFNIWEDMSFKTGPLVSPATFREFFLPRYKRLIDHLKAHGIKLITIDTDGDPRKLIPLYLEAGVNALWPIEITNGLDPIVLRKEYGSDLALMGGIDKKALSQGKQEIEAELKRILDYMLPRGGYIPTVDHSIPPDVSYANFIYYLELKKDLLKG